jgi:hypothetical protein
LSTTRVKTAGPGEQIQKMRWMSRTDFYATDLLTTHSFILFSKASLYFSFANSFFLSISSLDPSNLAGIGSGSGEFCWDIDSGELVVLVELAPVGGLGGCDGSGGKVEVVCGGSIGRPG